MSSGGKREGAGRPEGTTMPVKKIYVAARIDPEIARWLKSHKNYSTIIEQSLIEYREKTKE